IAAEVNPFDVRPPVDLLATPAPEPRPAAPVVQAPPGAPPVEPYGDGKVPLGVQSVLAANNGLTPQVQYVPVPVVTVPDVRRVPNPPEPRIPEAPDPASYTNAFTPPPRKVPVPPQALL